jgi:hypothetical protein
MATGTSDMKLVSLPSAWDAAELERLRLRDGTTYAQVIADINAGLALFNGTLTSGWLSNLFSLTTDIGFEYRNGATDSYQDETEYSQPDAKRGETKGHMLPLKGYDRKMEWSELFLENARRAQLDADIATALQVSGDLWEKAIFTRLFKYEEETGAQYGLGATGVSVPFVDGSGQTQTFVPVARADRGGTFASSHSHYLRLSGITQANIETAVQHLWEHGHDGPYTLIGSDADVASWTNTTNVTGYKPRAYQGIAYGSDQTLATVGEEYLGVISTRRGSVYLKLYGRIPTNYWGVVKTYGANDQRNPLKIRYDEVRGLGVQLKVGMMNLYPLTGAVTRMKFGVGVGMDRTTAVLVENDSSGSYATPTIS